MGRYSRSASVDSGLRILDSRCWILDSGDDAFLFFLAFRVHLVSSPFRSELFWEPEVVNYPMVLISESIPERGDAGALELRGP